MKIIRATEKDFRNVKHIVHVTIQRIYPLYYPTGAVDFFIRHHSDKNIWDDIDTGQVYILCDGGGYKGTVTVRENEIDRLFVLPEYQDRGYGKALLGFAEDMIFQEYDHVVLAASFPAKNIYMERGYVETEYNMIETENGDFLCFDMMRKEKL